MKKIFLSAFVLSALAVGAQAQKLSSSKVPAAAKAGFTKMHPSVKVSGWEKEDGNFEANWKEKGTDHSALFTAQGTFVSSENDIPAAALPAAIGKYAQEHYHAKIKEASMNKDAAGTVTYEANIKGHALLFDKEGRFMKETEGD